MSAMMGTDLGHLCALQTVMGIVNRPANTGGSGLSPGRGTRRSACGMVIMGAARRQDDRDRELEVIAVAREPAGSVPACHIRQAVQDREVR